MGVNSLPKTVTRQRRDCDLNPGPTASESSTLTTRLPSHPLTMYLHLISGKLKLIGLTCTCTCSARLYPPDEPTNESTNQRTSAYSCSVRSISFDLSRAGGSLGVQLGLARAALSTPAHRSVTRAGVVTHPPRPARARSSHRLPSS